MTAASVWRDPLAQPVTTTAAPPQPATSGSTKALPTLVTELWELVVAYVKQETLVPLKSLGRFIAFGVAGSVLIATGSVLLVLAALRALQAETGDVFDGRLSFAPYLLTVVLCGIFIGLAVRAIGKEKRQGSSAARKGSR